MLSLFADCFAEAELATRSGGVLAAGAGQALGARGAEHASHRAPGLRRDALREPAACGDYDRLHALTVREFQEELLEDAQYEHYRRDGKAANFLAVSGAVELHDSVAQNLTAVAMELETARQFQDGAPREMLDHLGIAWRTLKSCREELRNCLWDLRSQALEEPDMETAVRRTLLPHVKGVDVEVRFDVPRTLISDNTTHAILRIIRELVLNGIRHGGAKTIRVEGGVEGGALSFSVQDDGRGFDPEKCPGVADGHFGLQGIRERVRQLSGTLAIESGPGRGAKAIVTIPIPKGDKDDQGSAD